MTRHSVQSEPMQKFTGGAPLRSYIECISWGVLTLVVSWEKLSLSLICFYLISGLSKVFYGYGYILQCVERRGQVKFRRQSCKNQSILNLTLLDVKLVKLSNWEKTETPESGWDWLVIRTKALRSP